MYKLLIVLCAILSDNIINIGFAVQDFYWRDYTHGVIPDDAFEAKPGLYVGQAYYELGGLLPVTIYPNRNYAVGVYDSKAEIKDNIKILCSPTRNKFYWEAIDFTNSNGGNLASAVKGGYQKNQNLFIGAALHDGEWKIGKVKLSDGNHGKGLFVWGKNGKYVWIGNCYLLKYNHTQSNDYTFDVRSYK